MLANLLAFDTSTESMAITLQSPHGVDFWNGAGGAQASAVLLPRVQAMLRAHALQVADLDAIAFGAGPGAFTGLRTACSVAQGLAFGAGRPVLPIDSLLIVAEDVRADHVADHAADHAADAPLDVGVAMDARMGELYAARYRWHDGRWQTVCAPMLCGPAMLAGRWRGSMPEVVAGSGVHLLPALDGGRSLALRAHTTDRARALLGLARQQHADGAAVDARQALPLYLRNNVALTTQERADKRRAAEASA
jgi:tRNA threonylcarbamoyladenosine biosynthesis protein TsaB